MSSIKFSQLQSLTSPPNDAVFPAVSSGSNYKVTLSSIKTAVIPSWSEVTGKPNFNSVAFSGLYADLSGKPSIPVIPTLVSAFTNDKGYLATVDYGIITNTPQLSAVATSGNWNDVVNKPAWFNTTAPGYLYSDGSGTLTFQNVIDTSGGVSTATVKALIANSLSNFVSGTTTATVTALIANSLSNFVSGVSTATVTALIANSLSNFVSGVSTATVTTLIANSLTNNLATVARTGNWTDVVNKPAWFSTTATGYLYSDGTGTLGFQGGAGGSGFQLSSSTVYVTLTSDGSLTLPNSGLIDFNYPYTRLKNTANNTGVQLGSPDDQNYVNVDNTAVTIQVNSDGVTGPHTLPQHNWIFGQDGTIVSETGRNITGELSGNTDNGNNFGYLPIAIKNASGYKRLIGVNSTAQTWITLNDIGTQLGINPGWINGAIIEYQAFSCGISWQGSMVGQIIIASNQAYQMNVSHTETAITNGGGNPADVTFSNLDLWHANGGELQARRTDSGSGQQLDIIWTARVFVNASENYC